MKKIMLMMRKKLRKIVAENEKIEDSENIEAENVVDEIEEISESEAEKSENTVEEIMKIQKMPKKL